MRLPLLAALRQRDFAIAWAGQTVSLFGDGIFGVALAWQALEMPSGTATLGAALAIRAVARVAVLLVAGALADRYDKRLPVVSADALQLISVGALAYLVSTDLVQQWHIIVVAIMTGVGSGVFLGSSNALIADIVQEEHLQSANSLRSSGMLFAFDLLGPALGGILVAALGTAAAFTVDAATFAVSIAALLAIRVPRAAITETTLMSDVKEGIGYVGRTPWIWVSLLAVGTIGNFAAFGPIAVLIPLFVRDGIGGGAEVLGFVFAGYGLGGVLGALFMGSVRLPLKNPVPAYLGWGLSAVSLGVVAFAPNALAAAVCLAVSSFAGQIGEVTWATLLQRFVPRRLLGRVTSTDWLVSLSLQPLGLAIAAPVAAVLGVGGALLAGAGLATAAIAAGLATPAIRHMQGAERGR